MLTQLNALLWGKGMTLALIVSALFFTRLVPFGQLGKGFRKVLGDHAGRDAFFTALAGTLGIGGMAGVAAAIALGGAGLLPPSASATLHNFSTLGISLHSMTSLPCKEIETKPEKRS